MAEEEQKLKSKLKKIATPIKRLYDIVTENKITSFFISTAILGGALVAGTGYWYFTRDKKTKTKEPQYQVSSKYQDYLEGMGHYGKTVESKGDTIEKKLLADYNFGDYNVKMFNLKNHNTKEELSVLQTVTDVFHDKATHRVIWQYVFDSKEKKVIFARKTDLTLFNKRVSVYESSDTNSVSNIILKKANDNYDYWARRSEKKIKSELENQLR